MNNSTTSDSNIPGKVMLEGDVECHNSEKNNDNERSHIATALIGHFREYYNLNEDKINESLKLR